MNCFADIIFSSFHFIAIGSLHQAGKLPIVLEFKDLKKKFLLVLDRVSLGFEMSSPNMYRVHKFFEFIQYFEFWLEYYMSISGFSEFEFIENPNHRASLSFKG